MGNGVSVSVDVAMIVMAVAAIVTAMSPVVAIIVTHKLQSRDRSADRKILLASYAQGNDHYTRVVDARLGDLRRQKVVIKRLAGNNMTEAEVEALVEIDLDIEQLTREVQKRDETARRIGHIQEP